MRRIALALLGIVFLAGCAPIEPPRARVLEGETIRIVTTIGMITDVVEHVGGSRVEVEGLMGPGIDPHLYKASEGDLRRLERADVIFYGGLHLEAKMADVLERIQERRATQAVTDAIPRAKLLSPAQFKGQHDPHVWFDVRLWQLAVEQVRDTLSRLDPGSAGLYRRNAEAYLAELDGLDDYVRRQALRVPEDRRVIITAHDAFNYFGKAYGFEVRGLQGISTAAEAGAGDVQGLARFIADRRIPAIFVESSVSPRTIEAVREAVRARGFDVEIGGSLYSDAMGNPGTPDGTYVGMVRHNIDTIVEGLRG
ncbi:MAG TPA: zinc ABC transporter substrate-binding protein [Gaiellaceae bacterium]|nr:zinc ABC transporter substrate-binding protein [Gaiellaceae bacterium]